MEAFWFLGGIPPDEMLKKARRNRDFLKEYENDPIDRYFAKDAHVEGTLCYYINTSTVKSQRFRLT